MSSEYCFEGSAQFPSSYLGSSVNEELDEKEAIRKRIAVGNRTYFPLYKIVNRRLVNQSKKFRLYKALIRPVVTFGGKTWTLNRSAIELERFETKFLRRITGSICVNVIWQRRKIKN